MSNLLILPIIEVQAYNMLQTQWLISSTPVMAINLFTHRVERELNIEVTGVSIVHHTYAYIGSGTRMTSYRSAALIDSNDYAGGRGKSPGAIASQPNAKGRMKISLILECSDMPNREKLKQFMHTARIAGGSVIGYGSPVFGAAIDDVPKIIKTGFYVNERADLLQDTNQLETFINLFGRNKDETINTENSWLSATCLGYHQLTTPKTKPGSRQDYQHMFVEPLVGIIQYVSKHSSPYPIFWKRKWLTDKTFVVTQSN